MHPTPCTDESIAALPNAGWRDVENLASAESPDACMIHMPPASTHRHQGCMRRESTSKRPQKRLDRRLEEVAKTVGSGYCQLQMPLKPALGVRGTVAGHRLGALEGGHLHPFQCIPDHHSTHLQPLTVSRVHGAQAHTGRRWSASWQPSQVGGASPLSPPLGCVLGYTCVASGARGWTCGAPGGCGTTTCLLRC